MSKPVLRPRNVSASTSCVDASFEFETLYLCRMASQPVRFECVFPVTNEDIDDLGHVNNVVYLRWVQDVAAAHWQSATTPI